MLVEMMASQKTSVSVQTLLDHLYTVTYERDEKESVSPAFLNFAVLYCWITGSTHDVVVYAPPAPDTKLAEPAPNAPRPARVSILKFLNKQFDIPQEFFEGFYACFMRSTEQFAGQAIKFFRRFV
jgi:hypothetical protein